MAIEKREAEYAKESDDVLALVVKIVKEAKAGKSVAEIGASSLEELVTAVAGADQIPGEARQSPSALSRTVHDRAWEIADALSAEAPEDPEPDAA